MEFPDAKDPSSPPVEVNAPPPADQHVRSIARVQETLAPKYEMSFKGADRLSRFDALRFFSPALLYLYGRFNDEPLVQFLTDYAADARFMYRRFEQPIFQGMDAGNDKAWNHVLWAVYERHWASLEAYLLSLTMADSAEQIVFRYGAQDVQVADPLFVDQLGLLVPSRFPRIPLLPVVVLGVDASTFAASVTVVPPGPAQIVPVPKVQFHPPQAPTVAFARAYFGGDNPVAASTSLEPVL